MRPFYPSFVDRSARSTHFLTSAPSAIQKLSSLDFHLRAGQNFILFKGKLCARQQIAQPCSVKSVIGQDRILCTASARSSASIAP